MNTNDADPAASTDGAKPIYCDLCRLPHRPGTLLCEDCGHELGTPPNWHALEQELPRLRASIALGFLALAGTVGLNLALFGGAGYVVLLAPIGWIVQGGYRYAILTKRLTARHGG